MSSVLVAAIDFGTTYSGWAFSFKHDFEKDPTKVSAKNWIGDTLISPKAPTCVLIKPDGKTLDSFGYAAEAKYAELALEGAHEPWYYFRRFKMMLHDKMKIQRHVMLEDEAGKQLPAKTVFSLAIKFLKEDLLEDCHKQLADALREDDDIKWVLTVPAIWNDGAKQFMREAAEQAGITSSKLMIALEPEAASLYCRYLPVKKGHEDNSLASFEPGSTYIVLDAGGGTIDITVHQVIVDGKLRELHRASGGAWGGTMVDKAYEKFLEDIAGLETFQQFKKNHMDDYIDLVRTFEVKKRETTAGYSDKVTYRIPPSFDDTLRSITGRSINEKISSLPFQKKVSYVSGKLRVDVEIAKSFFTQSVDNIVQHLSSMLEEEVNSKCKAIVMVGGFSESKYLQDAVKSTFERNLQDTVKSKTGRSLNVIIPDGAGLAVLKGAVIFGHRPDAIAERICKYTYGQSVSHKTTSHCNHPPTRTKVIEEQLRCHDIFSKHITIGQTVKLEEEQPEKITGLPHADQTVFTKKIFASTSPDPYLVTEPECICIGKFKISLPDTSLGTERKFGTRFIFGGTEIAVKVEDKSTGKIYINHIDCSE